MAIMRKDHDVYDPFRDLRKLQSEINELFDFDRFPGTEGLFDRNFSPAIDVVETPDGFTVTCELPGLDQQEVDINLASNVLTIRGEKKTEKPEKEARVFRREIRKGGFQRTLSLPVAVDSEKTTAELKEGVLTIMLPKREDVKPKQISVNIK